MKEIKEALYILKLTYVVVDDYVFPNIHKMPFKYISPSSTVIEFKENIINIYDSAENYTKSKEAKPSDCFPYSLIKKVILTTTSLEDRTTIRNQYLTIMISMIDDNQNQYLYCTDFKVVPVLKKLFLEKNIEVDDTLNLGEICDWDSKRINKYLHDLTRKQK